MEKRNELKYKTFKVKQSKYKENQKKINMKIYNFQEIQCPSRNELWLKWLSGGVMGSNPLTAGWFLSVVAPTMATQKIPSCAA